MSFYVEIDGGCDLDVNEIWPDGDAPVNPTIADVVAEIEAGNLSLHRFIVDWGIPIEGRVSGRPVNLR